ncbi:hypothetical protein AB0O91_21195 [Kitasatospora sp. NPDC089797]|uniref:hypothetical protein n=1 Tax=Kitasatospora sp. NPDC089797 TaxID=3155298 RepID=UPI00341C1ED5
MTAVLVILAASAAVLVIRAWTSPDARAYRAYRRSLAAQRRTCPCGYPIHKHVPIRHQRTAEESR